MPLGHLVDHLTHGGGGSNNGLELHVAGSTDPVDHEDQVVELTRNVTIGDFWNTQGLSTNTFLPLWCASIS